MKRISASSFFFILIVLLLVSACRKDPLVWKINNLNNNQVHVFGHGGMGYLHRLPMNSEASLRECLAVGVDGVEVDLQLSADTVFFLFHDENLEKGSHCSGLIENQNSADLMTCEYRKGHGHKIIMASQLLSWAGGKQVVLDCKGVPASGEGRRRYARALLSMIGEHAPSRFLIESTDPDFLILLSVLSDKLRLYFYCTSLQDAVQLSKAVKLEGFTIDMRKISARDIEIAHENGLRVTLFNVSSKQENMSALGMSPDNIQTDLPRHLVEAYMKELH